MALDGKVLREIRSQFAMVNWKRRISGYISLLTPGAEQAAMPALVVAMIVLIGLGVTNPLRKPRENG